MTASSRTGAVSPVLSRVDCVIEEQEALWTFVPIWWRGCVSWLHGQVEEPASGAFGSVWCEQLLFFELFERAPGVLCSDTGDGR